MFLKLKERIHYAHHCILHRRSLAAQKNWQGKRLRRMVAYANDNVSMWRSIFIQNNVDPRSILTLNDISKLPVTNKRIYLGKMPEEYTDSSKPLFSRWYVTSGTSGMPFTFLPSKRSHSTKHSDFDSMRFLWWRGERLGHIMNINFARIKIHARSSEHRFFLSVGEYLKDPRGSLKKIIAFKPEIIGTYPSLLLDIAKLVEKEPELRNPELKYAMSFGETLEPLVRKSVEDYLSCEIYDRYGLEEIGAVGVECAKHNGFHINSESVIVEIVDDAHQVIGPEEQGKIVVTDLFNFGMPFIRYDTGDTGRISYEQCACGLRSPRLWVMGRHSAYLSFPERRIHHLEFDAAMDTFMNYIFQYQIAKISDVEICARIIPGPAFNDDVPKEIKEHLHELVGHNIRVNVEKVSSIPISPQGKSRIVIDESTGTKVD